MGKALSGELFCMRTGIVMLIGTYLYNAKVWESFEWKAKILTSIKFEYLLLHMAYGPFSCYSNCLYIFRAQVVGKSMMT